MESACYDALAETRARIEETLTKMLYVKREGKNFAELRELSTQASVAFLNLRQINRMILQEEDHVKQETEAAKLPVEFLTTQLNNLLYQKSHYLKAINACKGLETKDKEIELISEEELYRHAPEELMKDKAQQPKPHKLMLKRLSYELYKRKKLCKQREVLEARKKMLQDKLANQKKFLSSLPSQLRALKKASLPVQQQLGIHCTKHSRQHQLVELLPIPLFILYSQLLDQKDSFDENIKLEIVGSVEDTQTVAYQQAMGNSDINTGRLEESKSVSELDGEDDDSYHQREKVKASDLNGSLQHDVYCTHPLSVLWHIHDKVADGQKGDKLLTLRFEFLMKLKVVCAGIENPQNGQELLMQLFPDDTGLHLPTQVAKLIAGEDFQYDVSRSLHPYKWAQHLAGINFLSEVPSEKVLEKEALKGMILHPGLTKQRQQHRVQILLEKLRSRSKFYRQSIEDFIY